MSARNRPRRGRDADRPRNTRDDGPEVEATDAEGLAIGRATPEGTARFAARHADLPDHFRRPDRLELSSLALGTRRGDPGGIDDLLYRSAVDQCFEGGVNVINTALSDRMQTSERAVGAALARAFAEKAVARDEVVVVTKGGELTPAPEEAGTYAQAQRALYRTYVDTGLVDPSRVVNGNCIDPPFLLDQIARSRANLRLATLDFYLLQEPELHLRSEGPSQFRERLVEAFRALEEAVGRGWLGGYGVCTWEGLLVPQSERGHLSLVEVYDAALEAGDGGHHLCVVQLPYGVASGEGVALASQLGPDGQLSAAIDMLRDTGTAVMGSAPLFGGRVLGRLPGFVGRALPEARTDAQRCLQFARSTANVTCAVVGMREPDHVEENLALLRHAPADPEIPRRLFREATSETGRG